MNARLPPSRELQDPVTIKPKQRSKNETLSDTPVLTPNLDEFDYIPIRLETMHERIGLE